MARGIVLCAMMAGAAAAADTIVVSAGDPAPQQPIPSNYVGFSIEVPDAAIMIGRSPNPPRVAFGNLISGLHYSANQLPTLIRPGGNSADESVWNPTLAPLPPQYDVHYNITQADLDSYAAFAKHMDAGVAFVIDLSFIRGDNASWPAAEVAAIGSTIGWDAIHAVSIGNECDIFAKNGLRPANYTYADYKVEWERYASALRAAGLPPKRIRGATWCCFGKTFDAAAFADHAAAEAEHLEAISYHRYPTDHCNGKMTSLKALLSPESAAGQAGKMMPFAQGAAAAGVPFVIGESNSVACGGQANVSDVMGSALWAVDYLLHMSSTNASVVNFHGGPRGLYAAIEFESDDPGTPPTVNPLYYAMRLISEVTANGAQVLQLTTKTSTNSQVAVWALRTPGAGVAFVVVHKDPSATGPAAVTVSRSDHLGDPTAQMGVLRAEGGVLARTGLSWAGQTFDGSKDGLPVGARSTTPVTKSADGSYSFSVEPATIAVLWT